jgi:hypothetical protein
MARGLAIWRAPRRRQTSDSISTSKFSRNRLRLERMELYL